MAQTQNHQFDPGFEPLDNTFRIIADDDPRLVCLTDGFDNDESYIAKIQGIEDDPWMDITAQYHAGGLHEFADKCNVCDGAGCYNARGKHGSQTLICDRCDGTGTV